MPRLYLTNAPARTVPADDTISWDDRAAGVVRKLGTAPEGSPGTVSAAETSNSTAWDVLLGTFVSPPLSTSGTLAVGSTVTYLAAMRESTANADQFARFQVSIYSGDGQTLRGVASDRLSPIETPTTLQGLTAAQGNTSGAVAYQAGDRLVIRVGYRPSGTDTTAYTGTLAYGGTSSTDLTAASTDMTHPGWVDVPSTLVFAAETPPGDILGIGPDVGQNHFSVQLAREAAVDIETYSQAEIAAGGDWPPYFTGSGAGTAAAFYVPTNGPTTSGSSSPRSELREVTADDVNMAFDPLTGTHTMRGISRITHMPAVNPAIVVAQLHNGVTGDRISIRTQLISGQIKLLCRVNGAQVNPRFSESYAPGTEFAWKFVVRDGGLVDVYYNDMSTALITGAGPLVTTGSASWYLKAGCYLQTTAAAEAAGEYGAVELRSLQVEHVAAASAISPATIASAGTVGLPAVASGAVVLHPVAIPSSAAVGVPQIFRGAISAGPAAIPSSAVVATPTVSPGPISVAPAAIPSTAGVAAPTVTPGGMVLQPQGISSTATVGQPAFVAGTIPLTPATVSSTSSVGTPTVTTGTALRPELLPSTAAVMAPSLLPGLVTVSAQTILGGSVVHAPGLVAGGLTVAPSTIVSTSTVGRPVVVEMLQIIRLVTIETTAVVYLPEFTAAAPDYPEPYPGHPVEPPGVHAGTPLSYDLRAGAPVP
jgi:hypothetical protein